MTGWLMSGMSKDRATWSACFLAASALLSVAPVKVQAGGDMFGPVEDSFDRELDTYRSARDARCEHNAGVFSQTGPAGAGHVGRCRLVADVWRLRNPVSIKHGHRYETWPEWH